MWTTNSTALETADRRLPWIIALSLTYILTAYIILPHVLRMGLKVLPPAAGFRTVQFGRELVHRK